MTPNAISDGSVYSSKKKNVLMALLSIALKIF